MSSYYDIPERSIEPPEQYCVLTDCQHEVYEGEKIYLWDGKWLCEDCFKDKVYELSIEELAEILHCDYREIE